MRVKQVLSNKVTRNAILYSMFILLIYRLGSYIVAPGTSTALINATQTAMDGSLGSMFNFFSGGNLSSYSLFMLGVSPYITASIVIQLLETDLVPAMAEWKHQGVDGSNKRSKYTKISAIVFAFAQSAGIIFALMFQNTTIDSQSAQYGLDTVYNMVTFDYVLMILSIVAGTVIMMWLADRITEKGVGNGISVIIMAGIISSLPATIGTIYNVYFADGFSVRNFSILGIIFVIQLLVILVVIYYSLAHIRIKVNYVRSSMGKTLDNSYIPIKINPGGVIPIIFVTPIMLIPVALLDYVPMFADNGKGKYDTVVRAMFDMSSTNQYWYVSLVVAIIFIILFSVFYSYVQMNPSNMTESLEKQSAYIVGVRPGEETESYLEHKILRTSLWGGIFLAFIYSVPTLVTQFGNIDSSINFNMLGSGLIIIVSVIVQVYESLVNKTETKSYKRIFGVK